MNIEEAADKFAREKYLHESTITVIQQMRNFEICIGGFKAGAKWQRNQVWHNPEEVPEEGKTLLVQTEYGPYICGPNNEYWKETAIEMSVIRWAYTDDLLSEGGEE